jgi:hypothetical protein
MIILVMAHRGERQASRPRLGAAADPPRVGREPDEVSGDVPLPPSGGWIAPDGRMWRCPDFQHERLAAAIVRQLGIQEGGDPGTLLERRGFIHVLDFGGVLGAGDGMTQAQLDVLFDLACTQPSMRETLMKELELHRLRSALL